jgi:hypothetical protein
MQWLTSPGEQRAPQIDYDFARSGEPPNRIAPHCWGHAAGWYAWDSGRWRSEIVSPPITGTVAGDSVHEPHA